MDDATAGTGAMESVLVSAAAGAGTWWGKTAVEVRRGEEGVVMVVGSFLIPLSPSSFNDFHINPFISYFKWH